MRMPLLTALSRAATSRRVIDLRISRTTAWSVLILAVLVVLLLRDAILFGRAFYVRDLHLQWYGQVESFVTSVTSGSWPVWDPFVSFGQPLLANANNQILYPLTWLNLLMRPWTYYTLFFAFHLMVSGAGMLVLGRRLGLSPPAALAAAAIWVASGPMLSLGNVWNHLAATAWTPWAVLAGDRAAASGRLKDALLWGAAMAAQLLAGSPDLLALTGLLTLPMALTAPEGGARARVVRVAAMTTTAGVFALLLSAGQLLPSLEVAGAADRWNMAAEERTYWSVHPVLAAQVLVPVFWGELPLNGVWSGLLFESREPFLLSLYLGPIVVGFALASLAAPFRGRGVFLAGALAFTLFAIGRFGPFYDVVVTVLPPLKIIRFPAKAMVVATFCICVLAGMGIEAWRRVETDRRRWLTLVALPSALLAIVMLALALLVKGNAEIWGPSFLVNLGTSFGATLAPSIAALTAVGSVGLAFALLAVLRARGRLGAAALPMAAIAVAQLAWTHRSLNPTAPRDLFVYRPPVLEALDQKDHRRVFVYDYLMTPDRSLRHLKRETPYVVPWVKGGTPEMWMGALGMRSYLVPPVGGAFRLYDSYGRDALNIQSTAVAELNAMLAYAEGTPLFLRLLRMGAVSQVIALHEEGLGALDPQATLPGPFLEPLRVLRVPGSLPRAYVVDGVRVSDRGLDVIEDASFDPFREVILPSGPTRRSAADFHGTARVLELRPDRVRLETTASAPAHVVLVDAWDPAWRATLDGQPVPVLRANAAFRAVEVPAGRHVVELVYRPASLVMGLAIAAAALLAGVGVLMRGRD